MEVASSFHAENISVYYGNVLAVDQVALDLKPGTVTAIVGPNGAGKSTLLTALVGGVRAKSGKSSMGGKSIDQMSPTARAKAGLVLVPQGRQIFPTLTVEENLQVMRMLCLFLAVALRVRWPDFRF